MGARLKYGKQFLATMEEIDGEEAMMDTILEFVAEGLSPKQIAEEKFGIVTSALWQWMRIKRTRENVYRKALRIYADTLVHEALADANSATDKDDTPAAKLKAEFKLKLAGKWDAENYGEQGRQSAGSGGGIAVYVQRGAALVLQTQDGQNYPPPISLDDIGPPPGLAAGVLPLPRDVTDA